MYNLFQGYENIVFDFDKTIASLPIDWATERENFKKFSKEKFGYIFDENFRVDEMEYVLFRNFPEKKKTILEFRKQLESSCMTNVFPNDEIIEIISVKKHKYFIISNNLYSTIIYYLNLYNISKKFIDIVGVDTYFSPKPCINSWVNLKSKFNLTESHTLFVGDSPDTDAKFAKSCGLSYFQLPSF